MISVGEQMISKNIVLLKVALEEDGLTGLSSNESFDTGDSCG